MLIPIHCREKMQGMLALRSMRMRSKATTGRHFDPEQGETAAGRAIVAGLSAKNHLFPVSSKKSGGAA
jgi:hypothetical protein